MISTAAPLLTSAPSFDQVIADYLPIIRRIAAAHESNVSTREDLVQDILCAVWRALSNYRGEGSLRGFIARVAANRAATHVQRALKVPDSAELIRDLVASEPSPEAHAIALDEKARLVSALRALPIGLREPVLLTLEGLTQQEIAECPRHHAERGRHPHDARQVPATQTYWRVGVASKDDAFWGELGISWRASIPDSRLISSRLEAQLKLQSALLTAGAIVGYAISLLSLGLAGWAFWIGWPSHTWNFLTRGVTLTALSLLAIMVTLALCARSGMETRSLREILQVSIVRTERLIKAADLTCYAMVILALGGMAGYVLRTRLARPLAVSPVEDLLALALVGLALVWYRRSQARTLRKYRYLSQAFGSDELQ